MEINVRTLLPVLLFFFLKESSAQTVHNVFTYTSKLMEELECTFTSTLVQWTEQREDGLSTRLFLYDVTNRLAQKETTDSKYDNFDYSIEGRDRFNLVIKNVDQGDAGRYQCNPITTDIVTFDVTVEDLPKSMNINCTESNVCMPSAGKETVPKITCVCTATGVSSSQFEIQWDGVDITSTSSTAYGSSSISSEITLQPPNGTSGISCSLTGYRSQVPKRLISYSYTFSPPVCTLTSECPLDGTSASLICSCSKGSPSKVHGYSFYESQMLLIGTQLDSSLQVNSDESETFYCKGCNGVLHDQFVSHALNCNHAKGLAFGWWILIIFGILLLLLVVVLVKRKNGVQPGRNPKNFGNPNEKVPLKNDDDIQSGRKVTRSDDGNGSAGTSEGRNVELKSADDKKITNGEDSPNHAPLDTERAEGDGKADTDTQEVKENIKDRTSQTKDGKESSVDLTSQAKDGKESSVDPTSQTKDGKESSVDLTSQAKDGKESSVDPNPMEQTEERGSHGKEGATHPSQPNHGKESSVDLPKNQGPEKNTEDSPQNPNTEGTSGDSTKDQDPEGNAEDRRSVTTNNSEASDQTSPNQTVSKQKKGEIRCQIRM